MRRILLLLSAVALTGCLNSTEPVDNPSNPATETFDPSLGIDISQMQKTEAGVYYLDVTEGTGDTLTTAGPITIAYAGYLKTGFLFGQDTSASLDLHSVIEGFADGMLAQPNMRVGGRRKLVIPSALAYGPASGPGIPANSTLVFDITLKALQ